MDLLEHLVGVLLGFGGEDLHRHAALRDGVLNFVHLPKSAASQEANLCDRRVVSFREGLAGLCDAALLLAARPHQRFGLHNRLVEDRCGARLWQEDNAVLHHRRARSEHICSCEIAAHDQDSHLSGEAAEALNRAQTVIARARDDAAIVVQIAAEELRVVIVVGVGEAFWVNNEDLSGAAFGEAGHVAPTARRQHRVLAAPQQLAHHVPMHR